MKRTDADDAVTLLAWDVAQIRRFLAAIQPEASDAAIRSAAFALAGFLEAALTAGQDAEPRGSHEVDDRNVGLVLALTNALRKVRRHPSVNTRIVDQACENYGLDEIDWDAVADEQARDRGRS